jgi:hypothetical protein
MISATYCFLSDGLGNVGHGLLISNSVANANTETITEKSQKLTTIWMPVKS